jgi:hypothetical protein
MWLFSLAFMVWRMSTWSLRESSSLRSSTGDIYLFEAPRGWEADFMEASCWVTWSAGRMLILGASGFYWYRERSKASIRLFHKS